MSASGLLMPLEFRDGRRLPCRIVPGPMDGVTEGSFVNVLSRRGYVWSWHTPFLRISTGVPGRSKLAASMAPFASTGLPVTVQLMGGHGGRLAETARRLHELGAVSVDLNCACPSPTVLGNGSGGARLRDLPWLRDTLRTMREACGNHGLSVKVRIGYESPSEFDGIAEVLRESDLDMVTVHFRTVKELYRPVEGGLSRLRRAVELLPGVAVFGSGDLFSVDDCIRMVEDTGVSGVMPARGLMSNPRLMLDLRHRLVGDSALPELDGLRYLLELAEECGRSRRSSNGFVLRVANAMYGKESEIFSKLTSWRTVEGTVEGLRALVEQRNEA